MTTISFWLVAKFLHLSLLFSFGLAQDPIQHVQRNSKEDLQRNVNKYPQQVGKGDNSQLNKQQQQQQQQHRLPVQQGQLDLKQNKLQQPIGQGNQFNNQNQQQNVGPNQAVLAHNAVVENGNALPNVGNVQPKFIPNVAQNQARGIPVQPGAAQKNIKPGSRYINSAATIAFTKECSEDIGRICEGMKLSNNIDILTCLNEREFEDDELSDDCHSLVWHYKLNVTTNPKFDSIARQMCRQGLSMFSDCEKESDGSGKLIPCLLEHREQIKVTTCASFLKKISSIIYSDFRLICNFIGDCKMDIIANRCGRVGGNGELVEDATHTSQGAVIACLEGVFADGKPLDSKCRKQITRIGELSADDYNLDRNLYFKCRNERDRLCDHEVAGEGRIYRCLLNHKFNADMTSDCREAITLRQKLVSQDYKASYSLQNGCAQEISRHCTVEHNANDQKDIIGLSTVLLCLEEKKLQGEILSSKCENQLIDFRHMMIENYELSAEVTHNCAAEIHKSCSGEIEKQETLHCLMGLAEQPPDKSNIPALSDKCSNAIMDIIKETEVAADYKMDKVLSRACSHLISTACNEHKEGDPMVLSCLMENLYTPQMNSECEKHLLELQYFISRDFSVDPVFHKKCKKDMKRLCHSDQRNMVGAGGGEDEDSDVEEAMPFNLVLSCLHRHVDPLTFQETDPKISPGCEEQVHRILKERALDFHLNPELEKKCRTSLGKFCSDDIAERGKELICLQDHYENLTDSGCRDEIQKLTSLESEDAGSLENILIAACEPMLQKYCKDVLQSEDEGKVMECLIQHKNDMESDKCAAGILHFQLIEMKDYQFSYKFLKACKRDVETLCRTPKSKPDVIMCLSKNVRDNKLHGAGQQVSKKCREQLTVENLELQQEKHENINLNPGVHKSCLTDFKQFCADVKPGKANGLECLREHYKDLSNDCRKQIHVFQKEEADNENLDFNLMRKCKKGIKAYCMTALQNGDTNSLISCLVTNKRNLDPPCKEVLFKREKEIFLDIELNPDLVEACRMDMDKFCQDEKQVARQDHEKGVDPHGLMYDCLKQHMAKAGRKKGLSPKCASHMVQVIAEEEKDYRLDPALTLHCLHAIKDHCDEVVPEKVVECLKISFAEGKINQHQCAMEIATMIDAGRTDVQADPVLQQACTSDIDSYCRKIVVGEGRVISCLVKNVEYLLPECKEELEARQKMWSSYQANVKGLSDLSQKIIDSDNSSYLLAMLTLMFIGVLFMGTICGRFTKRVVRDRKNR